MRKTLSRRRASLALCSCVGLSGCLSRFVGPSLDQLRFDAEVIEQASEYHPTRIRARLQNDGRGPVKFVTERAIVPRLESGFDFGPIVLFPDTPVAKNEEPEGPTNGCWRYTDSMLQENYEAKVRELHADEAYEETYSLYTVGEETECLPAGAYRFTDKLVKRNEESSRKIVVEVTIANDGAVTASGRILDE
ncbi:MAG: hypothetical protein ABEH81_10255 [Halopenitus sp.]